MHKPPSSARAPRVMTEGPAVSDAGGRQNGSSLAPAQDSLQRGAVAPVEPLAAVGARIAGLIGAPLAVSREPAAVLCGLSPRSWTRYDAQGLVPAALRIGGRRVWSVAELSNWIAAGAPPRSRWEAMRRTSGAR